MERSWAPWRREYILSDPPEGCVFCHAWSASPERDEDLLVVWREADAFVLMNRYPYNGGHVLVIPSAHVGDPADLDAAAWARLTDLLRRTTILVTEALSAQGANVGMNLGSVAGAGITDHLHFHVVPRWNGDTNFMPVVGETKVISESLVTSWRTLKKAFESQNGLQ
jgi:ATP adenylyltransferase